MLQTDRIGRVIEIADELRAIAANGLHWATNEYDKARYDKLTSLSAELLSMVDTREAIELESIFRGDLGTRTPLVGACAAIFSEQGKILLVQRSDNERWVMPGGAADVGESPSAVAVRESWEETGLRVRPTRLIGVYETPASHSVFGMHLYIMVFLCEKESGELGLTNETIAYGYFAEEEVAVLPLHSRQGLRIADAFKAYRGEIGGGVFQ